MHTVQARSLASTALETAQTDQSRAQSLTILARASHSAGAVQDAFRFYQQVRLKGNFLSQTPT